MRAMAWQRAKGELGSMLETYWAHDRDSNFEKLSKEIREFISTVEDGGLQE
jgi:hypothetical protein